MAAPVDLELKKAFTELQAKVIDTQQKVKLADIQIEQLNRTKKHAHLTDTEIMTLVDETNMYEGVGRMFILQSKEAIHNQLLEKQKIAEEKIKELEQKKSYLERSVKEAEQILEEAPHLPSCLSAGSREDRCKMLRSMHPLVPNCPPSPGVFSRATSHTNQQSQILGQPYCTTPGGPFTWATGSGQAVGKWGSRPHRDLGRNVSRGLLC
uniref:Prefoldin subunit 1 n=1 Tax=Phocoena sinus TaxID=42100 RepID=A0A8C9C0M0_PHOSS